MREAGDIRSDVPMDVADGVEDVWWTASCLADAVKCVRVAVSSPTEGSTEYIEGTMQVLLQAARAASEKAEGLFRMIRVDESNKPDAR